MPPKSTLWQYFTKIFDNKEYAICKFCSKRIKTCGNTTNLRCHLKSVHKQIFEETDQKKKSLSSTSTDSLQSMSLMSAYSQNLEAEENLDLSIEIDTPGPSTRTNSSCSRSSLSSTVSETKSYKKQKTVEESFIEILSSKEGGSKSIKITNAILYMICRDYQPISIVENEGFRDLLKVTAPHYKIPSRKTITNLLDNKYDAISKLFRIKISQLDHYSLTTDIWTDTMQSRSFLGLTIHFAENNNISSAILGVFELNERHTAEYLSGEFNNIFEIWGIKNEKVTVVISDGARNITKALENIFNKRRHLHCFAHQLNLLAERAIQSNEDLVNLIKKIKDIVTWFKQSNNASDELRKAQGQENAKKLIQEVPTRWNSTYYMLTRFLELRDIINQIIYRHPTAPVMVTSREILQLQEIQFLLKPLEAATKEVGGQNYTTASLVIPIIYNLHKAICSIEVTSSIGQNLKNSLLSEWERRFISAEQVYLLSIATLLDPRFKKIYFKNPLNCAKAVQDVQTLMQEQETTNQGLEYSLDAHEISNTSSELGAEVEVFDLWTDHQRLLNENVKGISADASSYPSEILLYLRNPVIARTENPLTWWNGMASTYPGLAKLGIKFLSTVATSVPSERLFSKSGLTATQQRNRLKGKRLSTLLFLQSIEKCFWGL